MDSRPIPIEELQIGEFYDIQNSGRNPRAIAALLLLKLPNHQAELLFMNNSDSKKEFTVQETRFLLRKRTLQAEAIQLGAVYPYQTFSDAPTILRWPSDYENEELINQISGEMHRAVNEGQWTFNLPHFLDGFLHIYLSYLSWRANCPKREERCELWFQFMGSYFIALRDHLLRVQLLPEANIRTLVAAVKSMDQLSERNMKIQLPGKRKLQPSYRNSKSDLKSLKNSAFDAYKPPELSSAELNSMWKCLLDEYRLDMVPSLGCEPLTLRALLLDSPNLIGILSRYQEYLKALSYAGFPGLLPEEILNVKLRIVVFGFRKQPSSMAKKEYRHSIQLTENLLTNYEESHLSPEEICHLFHKENLISKILESRSEALIQLVMTRTETFPSVLAYLKSNTKLNISIYNFLKCVIARITVKDLFFVAFVIQRKFLTLSISPYTMNYEKMHKHVKELIESFIDQKMSAELLRSLLPYESYGHFVFRAFAEDFFLTRSKEMMLNYFESEQQCMEAARKIMKTFHQIRTTSAYINKPLNHHLKEINVNLWYMFGGSAQIQFIWMRQLARSSIKRLSPGLTREICSYLA